MHYNFNIFGDKEQCTPQQDKPDLGTGSNVVARLARIVPPALNHKIYKENYLIVYLTKKNIHSVSTMLVNRLTFFNCLTEKEINRKEKKSR